MCRPMNCVPPRTNTLMFEISVHAAEVKKTVVAWVCFRINPSRRMRRFRQGQCQIHKTSIYETCSTIYRQSGGIIMAGFYA